MYAEQLLTPHSEIAAAGITPEPLLDSVRLHTIKAAYEASDGSYEDAVEAAYATAHLVRQTLRFEAHLPKQAPLSPEKLRAQQNTNCHGYSIVASECLEAVGVPHMIGFANQHSFILMQDKVSKRVNFIDTPVKELYTEITDAVGGAPFIEAGEHGAVNTLRGDTVLARSHFAESEHTREFETRPWMSFSNGKNVRFMQQESLQPLHRLPMRSYRPAAGRALLQAYANFTHAVYRSDFETAHTELQPLDSVYPDIDRRNKLEAPRTLVRELGRRGFITEALDDIAIIERSLWVSEDLSLRLWPIDQRRKLGVVARDASLIAGAIEEYEQLADHRRDQRKSSDAILPRIAKAHRQRRIASE